MHQPCQSARRQPVQLTFERSFLTLPLSRCKKPSKDVAFEGFRIRTVRSLCRDGLLGLIRRAVERSGEPVAKNRLQVIEVVSHVSGLAVVARVDRAPKSGGELNVRGALGVPAQQIPSVRLLFEFDGHLDPARGFNFDIGAPRSRVLIDAAFQRFYAAAIASGQVTDDFGHGGAVSFSSRGEGWVHVNFQKKGVPSFYSNTRSGPDVVHNYLAAATSGLGWERVTLAVALKLEFCNTAA